VGIFLKEQMMELKYRQDVAKLAPDNGIGIELGVAEGVFHERILRDTNMFFYGVDMYADRGHNVKEYKRALKRCMPYRGRYELLIMKFEEALDLFPDEYFDFIYIDGYAHTGQENGKTLTDWYKKLKVGGVFAGDDYAKEWPKVISVVDQFAKQYQKTVNVINCREKEKWCNFPTWYIIK